MTFCPNCEGLRAENAELRKALGLSGSISDRHKIARRFGLTRAESRLVHLLYNAAGRVVTHATLDLAVLSPEAAEAGAQSVKQHVCRIRRKMGDGLVESVRGDGYLMTPVGRALVYRVLNP